jgi:hypothetical protein
MVYCSFVVYPRMSGHAHTELQYQHWVPIYVDEQQVIPSVIMWFFDFQGFTPGLGETSGDAQTYWVDQEVLRYVRGQMRRMKERREKVPLALVFVHIPVKKARRLVKL